LDKEKDVFERHKKQRRFRKAQKTKAFLKGTKNKGVFERHKKQRRF